MGKDRELMIMMIKLIIIKHKAIGTQHICQFGVVNNSAIKPRKTSNML